MDLTKTNFDSVRANEGDAYPLGALPLNTEISCLEKIPGQNMHWMVAAGAYGTILRKYGNRVVVQVASKKEFAFDETCMATVGKLQPDDQSFYQLYGRTYGVLSPVSCRSGC